MKALIASGSGRYGDPWHPFPRSSARLGSILHAAGFLVSIDHDVDRALTRLDGFDLLVVNAGDPWRSPAGDAVVATTPDTAPFARALDRGVGVLAMHSAVSSLRDYPEWAPAVGAIWVPRVSHHPPIGPTSVRELAQDGSERGCFEVFDERYCSLQRIGRSRVVADHEGIAGMEPTAWVRRAGAARIAVDVLGHDERSFESAGHRDLVRRLALWATGFLADGDLAR
ncbi:ThuA domain-containing protein [Microbacterium trichothecenolyticum]|uniref:Trehalose utilization n=1 Tax=Microbacterium trichothecenolyticum TaxID=69370 RepID=A0A0M2H596_MICTR|nr:ThuA domain-containing protein [Microbacterium trichothecenolyticum]KJL41650.1 Trehalose utilization [Microbacterium trichothecenolyticum]